MGRYLGDLLFVIEHQQGDGQQDAPELVDSLVEAPRGGHLVALLQAGDEVTQVQPYCRDATLLPVSLPPALGRAPVPQGVREETGQRWKPHVRHASPRERLQEEGLQQLELDHTHLIVQQLQERERFSH